MGEITESQALIRHAVRLLPPAPDCLWWWWWWWWWSWWWWWHRPWPDAYLHLCDTNHCHVLRCSLTHLMLAVGLNLPLGNFWSALFSPSALCMLIFLQGTLELQHELKVCAKWSVINVFWVWFIHTGVCYYPPSKIWVTKNICKYVK